MFGLEALLIAGGIALAGLAYKKWGKPFLKKHLDDPKTPEDESAVLDPIADALIQTSIEQGVKELLAEADKRGAGKTLISVDKLAKDISGKHGITLEDAKARVNKALGR